MFLPLNPVLPLQHKRLHVRRHEPVVLAGVELLGARKGHVLADGRAHAVSPLANEQAQVYVVVDAVVVELLLGDLVLFVFKGKVDPLQDVERADGPCEQLVVDLEALDDVHRQDVLQLHHVLVH